MFVYNGYYAYIHPVAVQATTRTGIRSSADVKDLEDESKRNYAES